MAENKNESTTLVNFRVDSVVKDSAEAVLAGMGLNLSSYIGMALRKLAQDKNVPFDLKVDPDFWAAEAKVSKVMETIDNGTFMDVFELIVKKNAYFEYTFKEAMDASEYHYRFPIFMTSIDSTSLIAEYESLGRISRNANGKGADDMKGFCKDVREGIEELSMEFCEGHGIDLEESKATKLGLSKEHAAVYEVSAVMTDVLDVYDEHRSHLMMRFVNPKTDASVLEDIAAASEDRKEMREEDKDERRKCAIKSAAEYEVWVKGNDDEQEE